VDTGILQGSPVSPILFTAYLSGLFGYVEEKAPGIKALSFVDDVAWMAEGDVEDELSETLEQAATAAQEWADTNAVTFDTQKTEAILLSSAGTPPPRHPGSRQHNPFQRTGNPMARSLARLAADPERTPRRPDQKSPERTEQAPETRGTGRSLAGELPTDPGSMRPGGRPLRIGTLVEGQRHPRHRRPAGRGPQGDQPGSETRSRSVQDHQLGGTQLGIQTQTGSGTTGQPPARLRRFALAGLPRGDQARELIGASDNAPPRMLERQGRDGPPGRGFPARGDHYNRGRSGSRQ